LSAVDLAGITLFADLTPSQLVAVEQAFDEQHAEPGERLLREGYEGSGFYVVLSGEASLLKGGAPVQSSATNGGTAGPVTMRRGDWFGELSVLFGEPPVADVVATTPMELIVLAPGELEEFLLRFPKVMFRLLKGVAWRARDPERWK
jgi:CRP/FNR family transcriptional regulator, cyclic AMP receptor protein